MAFATGCAKQHVQAAQCCQHLTHQPTAVPSEPGRVQQPPAAAGGVRRISQRCVMQRSPGAVWHISPPWRIVCGWQGLNATAGHDLVEQAGNLRGTQIWPGWREIAELALHMHLEGSIQLHA